MAVCAAEQNVKHEKIGDEKSLFSRIVINLDPFSSVIYSSLIHRPEHLRLVLNCCVELVEVGSKILGHLGTFCF